MWIIAERSDGLKGDVSSALDGPLIILLQEHGAGEPCAGGFAWKGADASER